MIGRVTPARVTPARTCRAGSRLERRDPAPIVHPADADQVREIVRHAEILGGSRALAGRISRALP